MTEQELKNMVKGKFIKEIEEILSVYTEEIGILERTSQISRYSIIMNEVRDTFNTCIQQGNFNEVNSIINSELGVEIAKKIENQNYFKNAVTHQMLRMNDPTKKDYVIGFIENLDIDSQYKVCVILR